jgi:hypothetical protein
VVRGQLILSASLGGGSSTLCYSMCGLCCDAR